MKDKDFALVDQGTIQERQIKIGERIENIHTRTGEINTLINAIANQVHAVSGKRVEFDESQVRPLATDNIADDLLTIENNVRWLSNNLRTCVETLEESL
jgi:hypothetical protein